MSEKEGIGDQEVEVENEEEEKNRAAARCSLYQSYIARFGYIMGKTLEEIRRKAGDRKDWLRWVWADSRLPIRENPCIDVVNTDMPQELQEYAIQKMVAAVRSCRMYRDMAERVKRDMDIKFGSAWQCVVGKEFGIRISHMYGCFLFVTVDNLAVLVYRTE